MSMPSSSARADFEGLTQDDQIGDAALEHRRGRPEHAVVVSFGQHDLLPRGAGAFDQLELEHQRRDDRRASDTEDTQQLGRVDVVLEQRQRRVIATLRVGREPAARRHDPDGGLVGAQVRGDDRDFGAQTVQEPADRLRQLEPAVEDDARDGGEGPGGVCQQCRQEHFGAVGGDDHHRALVQARQDVDDRHGRHDHTEAQPIGHGFRILCTGSGSGEKDCRENGGQPAEQEIYKCHIADITF